MSKKKRVSVKPVSDVKPIKPNVFADAILDVNTSKDEALLKKSNANWAELGLHVGKAKSLVSEHISQLAPVIDSDDYYNTIPDDVKPNYRRAVALFIKAGEDLTDLAEEIDKVRAGRIEKITTLADYSRYNSISSQLATAMADYLNRTGPLIGAIITFGSPKEVDQNQEVVH